MQSPQIPHNESSRLDALQRLHILDTDTEHRFDRYTRLATRLFDVPISMITLVDKERQWSKSTVGIEIREVPRNLSFCGHTILQNAVMEVPDATQDERFFDNPIVTGEHGLRFYAGAPLVSQGGHNLGTLCIGDNKPRTLSTDQQQSLLDLASMVSDELKAFVDELTGLSNRFGFNLAAQSALRQRTSDAKDSSLVLFDLDNFKIINDTYGHQVGDAALQEFAQLLTDVFRRSDSICRLGGDEFCVLLMNATEQIAQQRIATLRERVALANLNADRSYTLEFSTGIYSTDNGVSQSTINHIINEADKLLYQNKAAKKQKSAAAEFETVSSA